MCVKYGRNKGTYKTYGRHGGKTLENFVSKQIIYDFGYFQTARHHKKALSAGLPERMNGLEKKS
jgi:hypothetical protein